MHGVQEVQAFAVALHEKRFLSKTNVIQQQDEAGNEYFFHVDIFVFTVAHFHLFHNTCLKTNQVLRHKTAGS